MAFYFCLLLSARHVTGQELLTLTSQVHVQAVVARALGQHGNKTS